MDTEDRALVEGFRKVCQSLKLYRRAELVDEQTGDALIDSLYVDPLPADKVLATLLEPHTTFLIGRKGTGKSTLFQKAQKELLARHHALSAYIDIKTIFESSQVEPALAQRLEQIPEALPREPLEKFLLHRAFIDSLATAIKEQLQKKITGSILARIKESFGGSAAKMEQGLNELVSSLNVPTFESAIGVLRAAVKEQSSATTTTEAKIDLGLTQTPGLSASGGRATTSTTGSQNDYSSVLFRTLDLKSYIARLRDLLARGGVKHLYVMIDDFSELPEDAMRFVVDSLLAPLNNWSEELVKLKVAAYPGRVYFGEIDKTKIDEVYLDLFRLYAPSDASSMETAATEFTRKLVIRRMDKFLPGRLSDVFDSNDEAIWRELFFSCSANPRILGYVLHFASERSLLKGTKITVRAIKESARKYYEEKIESYFGLGRFLHSTFAERLSIFSLKELLEVLVGRARELRKHDSGVFQKIAGVPPTSHFYVPTAMEQLLQSLELNFFLTKYFEMADRSGQRVSIYCLNYGLCERYSIRFGKPSGEREFRLYFVERVFDYSAFIKAFLSKNQEIACEGCAAKFEHEQLDALKLYGMQCPRCRNAKVRVTNLSRKYESDLREVSDNLLLGATELGILSTLNSETDPLKPREIATELDCSYQLVGRRAKELEERDLISRELQGSNQRVYRITRTAQHAYFSGPSSQPLELDAEEQ